MIQLKGIVGYLKGLIRPNQPVTVDTTFVSVQSDMILSGLLAKIGANAFAVLQAIKCHAKYETGQARPGIRRLAKLTGLSPNTVQKAINRLYGEGLLNVGKWGRGNCYTAYEKFEIRADDRLICTLIMDYVPTRMRSRLRNLKCLVTRKAVQENDKSLLDKVEIIHAEESPEASSECNIPGLHEKGAEPEVPVVTVPPEKERGTGPLNANNTVVAKVMEIRDKSRQRQQERRKTSEGLSDKESKK